MCISKMETKPPRVVMKIGSAIFAALVCWGLQGCARTSTGVQAEVISSETLGNDTTYYDFSYTVKAKETEGQCNVKNVKDKVEIGRCELGLTNQVQIFQIRYDTVTFTNEIGRIEAGDSKKSFTETVGGREVNTAGVTNIDFENDCDGINFW